jgi:hypothetical protein
VHHFFSENESNYFYCLEWSPIFEVREQFPLLPLEETLAIAEECGVKHPANPRTKIPIVMTTDFLITTAVGLTETDHARAVKPASELADRRVIEKLDLERRYWQRRNVDWGVVTEREIPKVLARNIHWIHRQHDLADCGITQHQVQNVKRALESQLSAAPDESLPAINSICGACDDRLGLNPGDSLTVVRHLLARKIWRTEMQNPLHPSRPLRLSSTKELESN